MKRRQPSSWSDVATMCLRLGSMYLVLASPVSCWVPHHVQSLSSLHVETRRGHLTASAAVSLHKHVVEVVASSGVNEEELLSITKAIDTACEEAGFSCGKNMRCSVDSPSIPHSVPGALGRIVLLRTRLSDEFINELQCAIAEQMDKLLYSEDPALRQPVLVPIRSDVGNIVIENWNDYLGSIVEEEARQFDVAVPLPQGKQSTGLEFVPSLHVEIDGAHITNDVNATFWDTSTLLVFDGLVSNDLRTRLLDVVLGKADGEQPTAWDDSKDGPDPWRWIRGGLLDTPGEKDEQDTDDEGPCWGLRDEAISNLCCQHHDAIEEFERILSTLFPEFSVCRLPEAVFGSSVSPLTANAPTSGDEFSYHIDGDPNLTPPSPWTDIYGRYPNRLKGKPRFMSCLIYLNPEWDAREWGAPTRFLDIPTNKYWDVEPRPGRCVFMDQDISHTVVAPTHAAGNRPRYSLVWKLVLHPTTMNQDMTNLAGERESLWPEASYFGSADDGRKVDYR